MLLQRIVGAPGLLGNGTADGGAQRHCAGRERRHGRASPAPGRGRHAGRKLQESAGVRMAPPKEQPNSKGGPSCKE